MNPWLENPLLWHSVHNRLIVALADDLAPRLRPRYFVANEIHTYVIQPPDTPPAPRYPDIMVIQRGNPALTTAPTVEPSPYLTVPVPQAELIDEGYLEVRLIPSGEVVTVIELLSHTNKQRGEMRDEYLKKRKQLLKADVSFVEIDLLRAGPPMPYTERAQDAHYRLFIRHRDHPYQARLYPFNMRQPIPTFPLPLLPDDEEPIVDLQTLLNGVYERAGYDLVIHYNQPPEPPLRDDDAAWAAQELALAE
jgi:hypothetical protein